MSAKSFRILSHTADLRLEVFGKTIGELFHNAASAISHTLAPKYKENPAGKFRETIKIQSANLNALLIDFLNEVLAKSEINKAIYRVLSIKHQVSSEGADLEAEIVGFPVEKFEEDIKAVTYHEADITQDEKGIWKTKLVLDI